LKKIFPAMWSSVQLDTLSVSMWSVTCRCNSCIVFLTQYMKANAKLTACNNYVDYGHGVKKKRLFLKNIGRTYTL